MKARHKASLNSVPRTALPPQAPVEGQKKQKPNDTVPTATVSEIIQFPTSHDALNRLVDLMPFLLFLRTVIQLAQKRVQTIRNSIRSAIQRRTADEKSLSIISDENNALTPSLSLSNNSPAGMALSAILETSLEYVPFIGSVLTKLGSKSELGGIQQYFLTEIADIHAALDDLQQKVESGGITEEQLQADAKALDRRIGALIQELFVMEQGAETTRFELSNILSAVSAAPEQEFNTADVRSNNREDKWTFDPEHPERLVTPVILRNKKPYALPHSDELQFGHSLDVSGSGIVRLPSNLNPSHTILAQNCPLLEEIPGPITAYSISIRNTPKLTELPAIAPSAPGRRPRDMKYLDVSECPQFTSLADLTKLYGQSEESKALYVKDLYIVKTPITELPKTLIPERIYVLEDQPGLQELIEFCRKRRELTAQIRHQKWGYRGNSWDYYEIGIITDEMNQERNVQWDYQGDSWHKEIRYVFKRR